jgi:hypothetical protein
VGVDTMLEVNVPLPQGVHITEKSNNHPLLDVEEDLMSGNDEHFINLTEEDEQDLYEEIEDNAASSVQNATFHPFLKWANRRDLSKEWAYQSCIRHSDFIQFSFHIFEIPSTNNALDDLISSLQGDHEATAAIFLLLLLVQSNPYTMMLKRSHLQEMELHWTGIDPRSIYGSNISNADEPVRTFIFFRSCCRTTDWQLVREMYCIVWTMETARMLSARFEAGAERRFDEGDCQRFQTAEIIRSFHLLRGITGQLSIACALRGVSLVLCPFEDMDEARVRTHWRAPSDADLPVTMTTQLSILCKKAIKIYDGNPRHYQRNSLLQVIDYCGFDVVPQRLRLLGEGFGQFEAVLAIKPKKTWLQECPRFCLFVLLDRDFDNEERLKALLHDTIRKRRFFAVKAGLDHEEPSWTAEDWAILQDWSENFSEEEMLVN